MGMLLQLSPILHTLDIKASIEFYVECLGFTLRAYEPDWQWATVRKDDLDIMLSTPEDISFDKTVFTGALFFYVSDVDSLWKEVKNKAKVAYPLKTFDYGMKEFAIYDNNGYMLQFATESI